MFYSIVVELFKQEAETVKSLTSNNIISFRFFKEFSNYLCIGMELCMGGTLTEWISEQRELKDQKSPEQHEQD